MDVERSGAWLLLADCRPHVPWQRDVVVGRYIDPRTGRGDLGAHDVGHRVLAGRIRVALRHDHRCRDVLCGGELLLWLGQSLIRSVADRCFLLSRPLGLVLCVRSRAWDVGTLPPLRWLPQWVLPTGADRRWRDNLRRRIHCPGGDHLRHGDDRGQASGGCLRLGQRPVDRDLCQHCGRPIGRDVHPDGAGRRLVPDRGLQRIRLLLPGSAWWGVRRRHLGLGDGGGRFDHHRRGGGGAGVWRHCWGDLFFAGRRLRPVRVSDTHGRDVAQIWGGHVQPDEQRWCVFDR